ncbi:MAG: ADP-ribosylglycohydrolase family protein [Chitinophagales bacterium]|nr:ADP-ribosylglycohydrolase family protein [Chitinophagales bacterium]
MEFTKNNHNILVGTALGDALGAPFEKAKPSYEKLLKWSGLTFEDSHPDHFMKVEKGHWTDDTSMSLLVAQSLIDNKSFNPDDLSKRYVEWVYNGNPFGAGKTTLKAIENIKNGVHYSKSGIEGSWGNGTAMRSAPFGVFFRNDLKALIESVAIDAKITHNSNEAIAGSISVACMIYSIYNKIDDPIKFITEKLPESKVKHKICNLPTDKDLYNGLLEIGTKFDVRDTAPAVVFAYIKNPTFNGMIELIKAGFDTDTNASIFGAFLGASEIKFPQHLIDQIYNIDYIKKKDMELFSLQII